MKKLKVLTMLFVAMFIIFSFSCNQGKGGGQQKPSDTTDQNNLNNPKPNPQPSPNPAPTEIYDHLTEIHVYGGRFNGMYNAEILNKEVIQSILKGETKEVEVGPVCTVAFLSKTVMFKSAKINNSEHLHIIDQGGFEDYVCSAKKDIELIQVDKMTLDFEITADGGKVSKGKLVLKRKTEKADVPLYKLYLNNGYYDASDRDMIAEMTRKDNVSYPAKLIKDGKVLIQVLSDTPYLRDAKFNKGEAVKANRKQVGNSFYYVVETTLPVNPGDKFEIEVFPTNETLFKPVTLYFTIKS